MTTSTRTMLTDQITAQAQQFEEIYAQTDPYESLYEVPIEVTVHRQLTVVLCAGGPHIEAVAALDGNRVIDARLEGYWAGQRETYTIGRGTPIWRALEDYAHTVTEG